MFASYNLIPFGQRLRDIRKSLGFSQKEISKLSGINVDTLRKLESGQTLPRFDTLEHLSRIYKCNLLLLLDTYKSSKTLFHYYDQIDQLITNNDLESIKKIKTQFDRDHQEQKSILVNSKDYDQLNLFFESLILSYRQDITAVENALSMLIDALKLTIVGFDIYNFKNFKYTFFEQRILFLIASLLFQAKKSMLSNEILTYLLHHFDFSVYSSFNEKRLIAKTYSMIAYNYHIIDNHEKVIDFAKKGLEHCIANEISTYFALLQFRKGIAEYHLELPSYRESLHKALQLLSIYENDVLYQQYRHTLKHQYKIDIDHNPK